MDNNKIAVITGAARGNGRATAFSLGKSGYSLYLTDLNSQELEEAITDMKNEGIDASGGVYDASIVSDAKVLVEDVIKNFGRIDILVNNAGAS